MRLWGAEIPKKEKATDPYIKQITSKIAFQVLAFLAGEKEQPVSDSGITRGHSSSLIFLECFSQA